MILVSPRGIFGFFFFVLFLIFHACHVLGAGPKCDRVVLISFDGLRPDVLSKINLPAFKKVVFEGVSTLQAQTILPSVTLPAHVSLLTGLTPSRHKITQNHWILGWQRVKATTLFQRIKRAGLGTAMVCGKEKLGILAVPGNIDRYKYVPFSFGVEKQITAIALNILKDSKIKFIFIHYPFPDHAGHLYGWMTAQYYNEVRLMDKELKKVVTAIANDAANATLLIVTADHGGFGRRHGSGSREDKTIPWIAWGPMVKSHFAIPVAVNIYDTAAVILDALGLPGEKELDGKTLLFIWDKDKTPSRQIKFYK